MFFPRERRDWTWRGAPPFRFEDLICTPPISVLFTVLGCLLKCVPLSFFTSMREGVVRKRFGIMSAPLYRTQESALCCHLLPVQALKMTGCGRRLAACLDGPSVIFSAFYFCRPFADLGGWEVWRSGENDRADSFGNQSRQFPSFGNSAVRWPRFCSLSFN